MTLMKNYKLVLALGAIVVFSPTAADAASVTNGSFETGDFSGWIPTDIGVPFDVQAVLPVGTPTAFDGFLGSNVVIPSDGLFAQSNGFDGGGPDTISLAQDIGVIGSGEVLSSTIEPVGISLPSRFQAHWIVYLRSSSNRRAEVSRWAAS